MIVKAVTNIVHSNLKFAPGDTFKLGEEVNITEAEFKSLHKAGAIEIIKGEFELVNDNLELKSFNRDEVDKIVNDFTVRALELEKKLQERQETIDSLCKELEQTKVARDELEVALANAKKQIETLSLKKTKGDKDSGK